MEVWRPLGMAQAAYCSLSHRSLVVYIHNSPCTYRHTTPTSTHMAVLTKRPPHPKILGALWTKALNLVPDVDGFSRRKLLWPLSSQVPCV